MISEARGCSTLSARTIGTIGCYRTIGQIERTPEPWFSRTLPLAWWLAAHAQACPGRTSEGDGLGHQGERADDDREPERGVLEAERLGSEADADHRPRDGDGGQDEVAGERLGALAGGRQTAGAKRLMAARPPMKTSPCPSPATTAPTGTAPASAAPARAPQREREQADADRLAVAQPVEQELRHAGRAEHGERDHARQHCCIWAKGAGGG